MRKTTAMPRRKVLLFIALLTVAPVLLAIALYATLGYWTPQPTLQHGELLQPVQAVPEFQLMSASGPVHQADLVGHWTMLARVSAGCNESCAHVLYTMRQTRAALGRDMSRVQRWLLAPDDAAAGWDAALRDYPGTVRLYGDTAELAKLNEFLPTAADGALYLIDPLGNLVMHYPPAAEPEGVLKDLRRLLKYTRGIEHAPANQE